MPASNSGKGKERWVDKGMRGVADCKQISAGIESVRLITSASCFSIKYDNKNPHGK
jgi:hypothetical protein